MRLIFALLSISVSLALRADDSIYRIDTVAGSDRVGDNGPALNTILLQPEGIASDADGNIYIAEAVGHRVRKISPAGIITTVAGNGSPGFSGDGGPAAGAQLNSPYGLAFVQSTLYIADLGNARVRKIGSDGIISTIAGGGALPPADGARGTAVSLAAPRNVAADLSGTVYISDFGGHRVYRLSGSGFLTVFAGTGVPGFSGDGFSAALAKLAYPAGLALDRQGALYIADSQNRAVRKVANGVISSVAHALSPTGVLIDGLGDLDIADPGGSQIVRIPATGPAVAVSVAAHDLTFGWDGHVYAVDGSVMRQISFSGPSPIAAGGASPAGGDQGPATQAKLNHPSGVSTDGLGNLYIADRDNHRIRRVAANGIVTTVAGTGGAGDSGDHGAATLAQLNSPSSVTVDTFGNLYIADTGNRRVRKVTPGGAIIPVASAGLVAPVFALPDSAGNVYIADEGTGAILKVTQAGVMTAILTGLQSPHGLALDNGGNLYFTEAGGPRVSRLDSSGLLTTLGGAAWNIPRGIAIGPSGEIFVADTGLQQILRVNAGNSASPIAGTGVAGYSGDGGAAQSAELAFPWDVALGTSETLYIADLDNNRIRSLTPAAIPPPADQLLVALNAASLQPGPIAAGMVLTLQGADAAAENPQVFFDAVPALVLQADSTRFLVQVPPGVAGRLTTTLTVLVNGIVQAHAILQVKSAAPALFADVSNQALANNQDGSQNSPANPAARGSIVALYGTGEGISGAPVSVQIAGISANVSYAGPVAGYPGLLQVNATVPDGYFGSGQVSVSITAGQPPDQATSPAGVTIAVQ